MAVAVPLIGLALAAGSTAYSIHEGRVQAKEAKQDAREFEQRQLAMQQELSQKQSQQDADAASQQQMAMQRQRAVASGYQNASNTTFTSPLGMPGAANTAKQTLLGL